MAKKKTTSNVADWTEAKYFGWIRSKLRRGFLQYPPRYQAHRDSRTIGGYRCAECQGVFKAKEVAVDHIEPCGSLQSFDDLVSFVSKLYCPKDGLQCLCKSCHYDKTMAERGFTKEDVEVAQFKKLKSKAQCAKLESLGIKEVGKNAKAREQQYRETL